MGVRYTQPQTLVGIDWSNPITRGLLVAVNGATLTDLVSGKLVTQVGSSAKVVSQKGVSYNFDGSSYVSVPISWAAGPYTLFSFGVSTSNASNQIYCGIANSGSSTHTAEIYREKTNSSALFIEITGGSSAQTTNVPNSSSINNFYAIAGVAYATNNRVCYVNGVAIASVSSTLSFVSAIDVFNVGVERYSGALAGKFIGAIPVSCLWTRALSGTEVKSLSDNPWQIFAPIQRRIWVPASVASGFKSAWARDANSVLQLG